MKKFSRAWKKSTQPRKQRKYRANAPLHLKRKLVSATLSKELRKQYNKRSLTVKKGDTVKVMRGSKKSERGKISEVNLKKMKIKIEGVEVKRANGETAQIYIDPSNVMLTVLNMDDIKRKKFVKRKSPVKVVKNEK